MTKKKGKDYDDLDDVLGDLLAEDGPTPKKATGGKKYGKPGGRDNDFYSSLAAAAAENEMSDVSDADPAEMAKTISGLDDMDAELFGPKKTTPRTTPRKSTPTSAKKPPVADSKGNEGKDDWLFGDSVSTSVKPKDQSLLSSAIASDDFHIDSPGKSANKPAPKKTFKVDFDEDDPLAGLLSDEEDDKPKPKPSLKKALPKQDSVDDDSDKSQGSKRLDMERPPTRSGPVADTPTKQPAGRRKPADDIMFDDDDVLGGMGLDSPRHKSPTRTTRSSGDDESRPGGAMSILGDLLGGSSISKHLERPGSGDKKEFIFDRKSPATKQTAKDTAEVEEDFAFGSYMPSAATGSRPSSRRSVRFEDDGDTSGDRPSSRGSSAGKRRGPSSHLESMIDKDDRDWLDIASDVPTKKDMRVPDDKRPSSEGSLREKSTPNLNETSTSEPVDWLGLARLGSPDITPRTPDEERGISYETKKKTGPTSSAPPVKQATLPFDDDDDDEELPFPRAAKPKTPPQKEAVTMAEVDDWLGGVSKKAEKGNDYLGLGDDIDPDDMFNMTAPKRIDTGDEMFQSPQKHMSSSLPWDSERPRGRRDRSSSSHRSASADRSKGLSLDDDPQGLTLDALSQPSQSRADTSPHRAQRPPGGGDTASAVAPPTAVAPPRDERNEGGLFDSPNLFSDTPQLGWGGRSGLTQSAAMSQPQHTVGLPTVGQHTVGLPTVGQHTVGLPSPDMNRQQEHLRQQQLLRHQQETLRQQQQQAQTELQQQFQQREQELLLLKRQQHNMMDQQMAALNQPSTYGFSPAATMMSVGGGVAGDEYEARIRKLELEKMHLQLIFETIKAQHHEEVKVVEDSYKKRIEMLDDTWQKREHRLREENELLSSQGLQQLKRLENDKAEMMSNQLRQIELWEQDKLQEIKRIKSLHNDTLDELRNEHHRALQRVRQTKDQELEAAVSASDHARHLQAVISRVEDHASNLDELQQKVEGQQVIHLDQRETAARAKDQQLKGMQERLERQQHDNELERAKLQALISKLEQQLTEQTRQTEEEKWRVRQEESRMQTSQNGLAQERKILMEQIERDKLDVERSKSQLIEEQKAVLTQLAEERRALATERAQFNVTQRLKMDQEIKDSVKVKHDGVELESSLRFVNDEKSRVTAESRQVEVDREKLRVDKEQLDQQKRLFQVERERLEQLALDVNQKSRDIQDLCLKAAEARDEGQAASTAAQKKDHELREKDETITKQLKILRGKEKQIAEERLSLAREKHDLEKQQGAMSCVNCRTPVKDTSPTIQGGGGGPPYRMSPAAQTLYSSLGTELQGEVRTDMMTSISTAIEMDKHVRLWRKSAQKDKAFLTEESMFLQALRTTPYHNTNPHSMS